MPPNAAAMLVLTHYARLGKPLRVESLQGAGGFSGSQIWRVTLEPRSAEQQRFCLRRWPAEGPNRTRLQWIHAVLQHVGGSSSGPLSPWERALPNTSLSLWERARVRVFPPLDFVPVPLITDDAVSGQTIVSHAGYFWELAPWLPGAADYSTSPSPVRLAAAFQALARFHLAAETFAQPASAPAPAILERQARLAQLQHSYYERIAVAVHRLPGSPLVDCGNRLLELFPLIAPQMAIALDAAVRIAVPLQVAIRDVWHDHVLFTGDEVTGLIDFGAMRIDTPLADIARLVGSLAADDVAQRNLALDAYHPLRPLGEQDRWLIDLLDHSGQLLSGMNWLEWLFVDERQFDDHAAILNRLAQILVRLQRQPASRNINAD